VLDQYRCAPSADRQDAPAVAMATKWKLKVVVSSHSRKTEFIFIF
jgi:hypothetical protein